MLVWGAFCFGLVIGWITYRTLRRTKTNGLSDIATVIGAVGGAAILALFPVETVTFGAYSFGLAIGFFGYAIVAGIIDVRAVKNKSLKSVSLWLGSEGTEPNEEKADNRTAELPIAGH